MTTQRILIVDDEKEYAATLAERFELRHITAQVAFDGLTALKYLQESHPDLVLLDLMMPGMNGFDLLRCLRNKWPNLPVIVVAGQADPEAMEECRRLGAFRFMVKPVNIDTLCAEIHDAQRIASPEALGQPEA